MTAWLTSVQPSCLQRWHKRGGAWGGNTTALLDQLNAIEAHMDEVRPKRKTVLANLLFLGAVLLWLELVGAGWVWSALGVMAMGLRYVIPFAKLRSLDRPRGRARTMGPTHQEASAR